MVRRKGSYLIKEVIGYTVQSLQLSGTLSTPFPIKEVFQVRHTISPVKTVIGKKGLAFFGQVQFKVYCIGGDDLGLHLTEQTVHFRGFAFFDQSEAGQQPAVEVKAQVEDTFIEDIDKESLKIFAIMSAEITFTKDKEIETPDTILSGDKAVTAQDVTNSVNTFRIDIDQSGSGPELAIQDLTIE